MTQQEKYVLIKAANEAVQGRIAEFGKPNGDEDHAAVICAAGYHDSGDGDTYIVFTKDRRMFYVPARVWRDFLAGRPMIWRDHRHICGTVKLLGQNGNTTSTAKH